EHQSTSIPALNWPHRRLSLFPYTTLFRSLRHDEEGDQEHDRGKRDGIDQGPEEGVAGARLHRLGVGRCGDGLQRPPLLGPGLSRSEEHTSELQSRFDLVCRLLLEKKKKL